MSGLFLGGVLCDMPVMIDDDISAVAAFMAYAIEPKVKNIAVAGCCQSEISRQIFETMNIETDNGYSNGVDRWKVFLWHWQL